MATSNTQKIEYKSDSSLAEVFETLNRARFYPLSESNFKDWTYEIEFNGKYTLPTWILLSSNPDESKIFTKDASQQIYQNFNIKNFNGAELFEGQKTYGVKIIGPRYSGKSFISYFATLQQANDFMRLVLDMAALIK